MHMRKAQGIRPCSHVMYALSITVPRDLTDFFSMTCSGIGPTTWLRTLLPRVPSTSYAPSANGGHSLGIGSRSTSKSDGVLANNQTNLSLKGIIAIGAMAKISAVIGKMDDANRYQVCPLYMY